MSMPSLPKNLPELSGFTKMFTQIEGTFEKTIRQTGFDLPKGPQAQLLNLQKSIEAGKPFEPPTGESLNIAKQLPQLPSMQGLPPLPGTTDSTNASTTPTSNLQSNKANDPFIAGAARDKRRAADEPAIF